MKRRDKIQSMSKYVDELQSNGQYHFLKEDAAKNVATTEIGLRRSLDRLAQKKRVACVRNGFYLIVPLEYTVMGGQPASWYIDQFMAFEKRPYYVALLSAAELHGSAHQAPQEFQVMTNYPAIRPIEVGRSRAKFFTKKDIEKSKTQKIKTYTGYINVSTPEVTALDLIKYYYGAGYINHVATVLNELKEKLDPLAMKEMLASEDSVTHIQRLGVILEHVDAEEKLINIVHDSLKNKRQRLIPLWPEIESEGKHMTNKKWHVIMNDKIEVD